MIDGRARAVAGELVAELRDDLHDELVTLTGALDALEARVTSTHRQALRALTERLAKGAP